jgi:hypothetical protein
VHCHRGTRAAIAIAPELDVHQTLGLPPDEVGQARYELTFLVAVIVRTG